MPFDAELLRAMGLTREDFLAIDRATTREEHESKCLQFKEKVRQGYRRLSFQWHPDRGGSVEQLQRLNALKAELDAIEVPAWRPRPVVVATTVRTHPHTLRPMSGEQVAAVVGLHPGVLSDRDRF